LSFFTSPVQKSIAKKAMRIKRRPHCSIYARSSCLNEPISFRVLLRQQVIRIMLIFDIETSNKLSLDTAGYY
jgi:hypothetical protein